MVIEDFVFIVGAPRCGTTFLARHLRNHPLVCFSNVKEPHYFSANDLRGLPAAELSRRVEREYLDRFFPHRRNRCFLAEASVTYLYTPEQLEPILRLWPRAKFIVALRDPMEMVPSLYQRLRYIGDETVSDFGRAWSLVSQRRQGRHVPRRCAEPRWLDYWESGKQGYYLQRFFECIGRERCFVSVFDDLVEDPGAQFRRVLAFLGLPDDHQSTFAPERQSSGFRIPWLQRLLKRPPSFALSILGSEAHQLRLAPNATRERRGLPARILELRKRLIDWNKAAAPPVSLSPGLQAEMRAMFAEDVRLLEGIISRDLRHWLRSPKLIR